MAITINFNILSGLNTMRVAGAKTCPCHFD